MCVVGRSWLECHALPQGWVQRLSVPAKKRPLSIRDEVSLADVDSVSNMLRICKFMCSFEHVCCQMSYIVASRIDASRHDL